MRAPLEQLIRRARGSSRNVVVFIDSTPRADAGCPRSLARPAASDGGAGPAFARGAVRCECNLVVLDAGDVLDDAFPVSGPGIDAEGEVSSRGSHLLWPVCP